MRLMDDVGHLKANDLVLRFDTGKCSCGKTAFLNTILGEIQRRMHLHGSINLTFPTQVYMMKSPATSKHSPIVMIAFAWRMPTCYRTIIVLLFIVQPTKGQSILQAIVSISEQL